MVSCLRLWSIVSVQYSIVVYIVADALRRRDLTMLTSAPCLPMELKRGRHTLPASPDLRRIKSAEQCLLVTSMILNGLNTTEKIPTSASSNKVPASLRRCRIDQDASDRRQNTTSSFRRGHQYSRPNDYVPCPETVEHIRSRQNSGLGISRLVD